MWLQLQCRALRQFEEKPAMNVTRALSAKEPPVFSFHVVFQNAVSPVVQTVNEYYVP